MDPDWFDDRDDADRDDRPNTLLFCNHCADHVLVSEWNRHEAHDLESCGVDRYAHHDGDNTIEEGSE